jgi:hypothetical protein
MAPAFVTVPGMFASPKVGSSTFVSARVAAAPARPAAGVTMVVDAFQRKFQTAGRINVDYTRPKMPASFKRTSAGAKPLAYPQGPAMAGHYSISGCGARAGAAAILQKYDEYCAKGMLQVYKRSAVPNGYYTSKCTEATTPYGAAEGKRVFNRLSAFRQAQKPVNVRLAERFASRKAAMIMASGCHHEEKQFSSMPMSCATYLAGNAEASGSCFRNVLASSAAEDYMGSGIRAQLIQKKMTGVYPLGYCMDGHAKDQAEDRRVAALGAEFRAQQQSPSTVTAQAYEARRSAIKLYGHGCNHEEQQFSTYPNVAAAMMRY